MKLQDLQKLFEQEQRRELEFAGACHDCGVDTSVVARVSDDGQVTVTGGAVYQPWEKQIFFIKCDKCLQADPVLRNYQPTLVYSRVVGYLTPIDQWNKGKRAEFYKRETFNVEA